MSPGRTRATCAAAVDQQEVPFLALTELEQPGTSLAA